MKNTFFAFLGLALVASSHSAVAQGEPSADEAMEWVSSKVSETYCGLFGENTVKMEKVRPGQYQMRETSDSEYGYQVDTSEFDLSQIKSVKKTEKNGGYEIKIGLETHVKWSQNHRSKLDGKVTDRNYSTRFVSFYTCSLQMQDRVEKAVLHARDNAKAAEPF